MLPIGAYRQMALEKKTRFHILDAENVYIRQSLQVDFHENIFSYYIYGKVNVDRHYVKHWPTQPVSV
jgi:hypothetical protein